MVLKGWQSSWQRRNEGKVWWEIQRGRNTHTQTNTLIHRQPLLTSYQLYIPQGRRYTVHELCNKPGGYSVCVCVCACLLLFLSFFVCLCVCVWVKDRHRQTDCHLSGCRWACVWQPTSQEIMDGFSASCEIGPAMILVSRWGALLDQPSASLHFSRSLISLFISLLLSHPLIASHCPPSVPPVSLSLSAPSYRLTQIQLCASAATVHLCARTHVRGVCVSVCVYRLPHELQMGFTNTYQDWLPISCRVKNNITRAKNSPFNKSIEMRSISAASSISSFVFIMCVSWAAYALKHGSIIKPPHMQ